MILDPGSIQVNVNEVMIQVYMPEINDNSFNKSPLIFLHDSLGCIDLWRDFPAELGRMTGLNAVVYDREGYGRSQEFRSAQRDNLYLEKQADALNDLLETLSIDSAILFGHSDGGSIALIAAAKYPQKIKGVITEGAHVFVEEITLQGIRDAVVTYETTNLKQKLEKYHGSRTESVFRAWTETWLSPPFRSWNIESFLPSIKCPVLVIQGVNDEFGSEAQVDAIVNAVNDSKKLMMSSAAHTPHKEQKEDTLIASKNFIRSLLQ